MKKRALYKAYFDGEDEDARFALRRENDESAKTRLKV